MFGYTQVSNDMFPGKVMIRLLGLKFVYGILNDFLNIKSMPPSAIRQSSWNNNRHRNE